MDDTELNEEEREVIEWARSWEVKAQDADDGTIDLTVIISRPPWRKDEPEPDEGDEVRVTYGTEMPGLLWEAIGDGGRERAYAMMRAKAWDDVVSRALDGDGS